jgi:hypothetical protein
MEVTRFFETSVVFHVMHRVISQKVELFITAAERTSNLQLFSLTDTKKCYNAIENVRVHSTKPELCNKEFYGQT